MASHDTGEDERFAIPSLRSVIESPAYTPRNVVAVSGVVSAVVFLLGYALALDAEFGPEYLDSFTMHVSLVSLFGVQVVFYWSARYHLGVWERVQGCFDVDQRRYEAIVDPLLDRMYSAKRVGSEFVLVFGLFALWDWTSASTVPYGIWVEREENCLTHVYGTCIDSLSMINYVYGFVGLLLLFAGVHGVVHFLLLTRRITDLPLADIETAAERLEPIVRFSVFVAVFTFTAVFLLVVLLVRLFPLADADVLARTGGDDVVVTTLRGDELIRLADGEAVAVSGQEVVKLSSGDAIRLATDTGEFGTFVPLLFALLIVVGLLVFWIPQMAIHDRLVEAKRERLSALEAQYVDLVEECRAEARPAEHLSAELDVLEARRRNAKEIETWAYDLPSLLPFLGSATASSVTWLLSVTGELSNLLA